MTKRFIMIQNGNFYTVRDTVEKKPLGMFEFKDNQFPVYVCFHKIIDLMNDLSDENEQLKSELSKQKEISPKKEIERLKKIISCLREENIDLNEELMEYDSFKKLSKKDEEEFEKRFVKYDGNTIVDLKLIKGWIISDGDVDLLLEILNDEKTPKKIISKR